MFRINLLFTLILVGIGGQSQSLSTKILDRYYSIVKFEEGITSQKIKNLEQEDVRLLTYYGNNEYLVSTKDVQKFENLGLQKSIQEKIHIASNVRNNELSDWAIEGNDALLYVLYPEDINSVDIELLCKSNNIEVVAANTDNNIIEIKYPKDRLAHLASLPFVLGLEQTSPPSIPDDRLGRNLHRVNRLNQPFGVANNYTGEGVNILVRDDGAVFEHIDFTGRLNQDFVGNSRGDHGDGVAGIMTGAGNLDITNQGMAFGAFAYVTDYVASFLDETMDLHRNRNVVITNSSYSNGCNDGYTFVTRTVDQQMFDNPTLLHVFSAGNDGGSDCNYGAGSGWGNITGGHKIGKNVIAVANTANNGLVVPSSSRGPAADGRIKPDIAANGFNHISTIESQDYEPFGGTSAAAPVVAGVSAMLYDGYEDIFGELPPAGLIKAILLNSATEAGRKGPDFEYGWGLLNAYQASKTLEEERYLVQTISSGETQTLTFDIPDNVVQFKVMTYWPDQEGFTSSSRPLVNDLNTTLSIDTTVHLPWVLDITPDPTLLSLPATKGKDNRNNMEQISIDNPTPGTYTLNVEGSEIPFGDVTYYVVWQIITDDIVITHPNGLENLEVGEDEVIWWDAVDNGEEFTVELIDQSGVVIESKIINSERNSTSFDMPDRLIDGASVRISRGDKVDESDSLFVISEMVESLSSQKINDDIVINWTGVLGAEKYKVYILGEKYMEEVAIVDSTSYVVPPGEYIFSWVAVSAIFPSGREGRRSRAITIRPKPEALVIDNKDGNPCENEVITFETVKDTLTNYEWNFGQSSSPSEAFTAGPIDVVYSRRGDKLGFLRVNHEGGADAEIFNISVERAVKGSTISVADMGMREILVTSDLQYMDSVVWNMGDGTIINGNEANHTYANDGVFTITATGVSSKCVDLVLTEEVSILPSSVDDAPLNSFNIAPNPSNGNFWVELPPTTEHELTIDIISVDGRKVLSRKVVNPHFGQRIKFYDIIPGLHNIIVTSGAKVYRQKITIID